MSKQDTDENLPWYVNQQLSADERAEIEQQLKDDDALQQEVAFLNKLRQQIKHPAQQSPGEFGLQRLKHQIKQENSGRGLKRWKTFAVAASLLMVVQAGIMVSMLQTEDSGYAPLSGSDYAGSVIQVQFNDHATENAIRQTLLSVNGSIIEGPSASGVYRIRLEEKDSGAVDARIRQLQGKPDVVDFVAAE